jgi:hypothetical protein
MRGLVIELTLVLLSNAAHRAKKNYHNKLRNKLRQIQQVSTHGS